MSSPEIPEDLSGAYSIETENQLPQEDTLIDRGVDDILDEGYSPPEKWQDAKEDETLDERLADEEPDPTAQIEPADEQDEGEEVGDQRSGRLVAPDEGSGTDIEEDLVGSEVGVDGAGASAEEAAVHVVDDNVDGIDAEESRVQVDDADADEVVDDAIEELGGDVVDREG